MKKRPRRFARSYFFLARRQSLLFPYVDRDGLYVLVPGRGNRSGEVVDIGFLYHHTHLERFDQRDAALVKAAPDTGAIELGFLNKLKEQSVDRATLYSFAYYRRLTLCRGSKTGAVLRTSSLIAASIAGPIAGGLSCPRPGAGLGR